MHNFVWDYFRAIFHYWWVLVFVVVGAANNLWKWFHPTKTDIPIPHWVRLIIAVAAIIVAQVLVYHDAIHNLNQVISDKSVLTSENWQLKHPLQSAATPNVASQKQQPASRPAPARVTQTGDKNITQLGNNN